MKVETRARSASTPISSLCRKKKLGLTLHSPLSECMELPEQQRSSCRRTRVDLDISSSRLLRTFDDAASEETTKMQSLVSLLGLCGTKRETYLVGETGEVDSGVRRGSVDEVLSEPFLFLICPQDAADYEVV